MIEWKVCVDLLVNSYAYNFPLFGKKVNIHSLRLTRFFLIFPNFIKANHHDKLVHKSPHELLVAKS